MNKIKRLRWSYVYRTLDMDAPWFWKTDIKVLFLFEGRICSIGNVNVFPFVTAVSVLGKLWCGIAVFSRYHVPYCGIRTPPPPPPSSPLQQALIRKKGHQTSDLCVLDVISFLNKKTPEGVYAGCVGVRKNYRYVEWQWKVEWCITNKCVQKRRRYPVKD